MPADPLKKLLVRLTLDNKEFKSILTQVRSDLKSLFNEFHKESAKQNADAKALLEINKSQVAVQQRLQAEAKTLESVDKAKAQWEKQQQEVLNTKIKKLALQTAEFKKQSLESEKQLRDEKQSLSLQKERLALKEKEVNLFKVGQLRAQVKYTGFKAPDSSIPLGDQQVQLANEKLRLQALDKQVVALENQGKYRRVDAEYVRSLITSERALADVAETGLKREQLRLKTLEQQALATSKVASVSAMSRIKTGIGYTGYTPIDKSLSVEAQRIALDIEKQKFGLMEGELNVISKSTNERRVDVEAVSKQLQLQRAQLSLDERHIANLEAAAKLQSRTVNLSQVAQITGAIGFTAHPHEQPTGFLGKLFSPSAAEQMKAADEERARLTIMQQQLRVMMDEERFRKVDIAAVQKTINAEQNRLGLLQAQLRTQMERKEVELGIGEVRSKFAELFQGGGLVGQIAGGVFVGAAGFAVFNAVIEKAKELGQALTQASGPASQLRAQFEALAERKGQDPSEMMEKLRTSTRGLVKDYDLFRVANNFLKSGIKASTDQMVSFVGTTVNLGRSMGKSSDEVIHAMERAFLNPQYGMRRLAYVTGIDVRRFQQAIGGLPATMDPVTRATIMFNHSLAEEEKMLKLVGVPATTLPELLKQVDIANVNFIEDVAMAATGTTSFRDAIATISQKLIELGPRIHEIAEAFGKNLASAFDWVIVHKEEIIHFFEAIVAFKLTDWALSSTAAIVELTRALKSLSAIEGIATLLGNTGVGKLLKVLRPAEGGLIASEVGEASLVPVAEGFSGILVTVGEIGTAIAGWPLALAAAAAASVGVVIYKNRDAIIETGKETYSLSDVWHALGKSILDTWQKMIGSLKEDWIGFSNWFKETEFYQSVFEGTHSAWRSLLETMKDDWYAFTEKIVPPKFRKELEEAKRERKFTEGVKAYEKGAEPLQKEVKSASTIERSNLKPNEYADADKKRIEAIQKLIKYNEDYVDTLKSAKNYLYDQPELLGKVKDKISEINKQQVVLRAQIGIKPTAAKDEEIEKTLQEQRKLAQERMQLSMSVAKLELENTKQEIAKEEQLNKIRYDSGIISLESYTDRAKAIKQSDLIATIREIEEEKKARLKNLDDITHATLNGVRYTLADQEDINNRKILIEKNADIKIASAHLKTNNEIIQADRALLTNEESAYQGYITSLNQINTKGVEERVKITEKEFQLGRLSSDEYISQRKMLIEEEYELTTQGLDEQLAAAKDNAAEIEKINSKKFIAEADRISKLVELEMSADDNRLKLTQSRFDSAKKYLDIQAKIASLSFGVGAQGRQVEVTQELSRLTGEYIARLQMSPAYTEKGTEAWIKVNEQIAQASEQQRQYNIELAKMRDAATPIGSIFGQLAGILGNFQNSRGAQEIAGMFQNLQGSFEHLSKFTETATEYGGAGKFFGSLGTSFKALFQKGATTDTSDIRKTAQQIFDQGLTTSSDNLDNFSTQIIGVTQALKDLRDAAHSEANRLRGNIETTLKHQYQMGTPYVPVTGPALLHEGERVLTKDENKRFVENQKLLLIRIRQLESEHKTFNDLSYTDKVAIASGYSELKSHPSKDPSYQNNLNIYKQFLATASTIKMPTTATPSKHQEKSFLDKLSDKFAFPVFKGGKVIPSFQHGGIVPGSGPQLIEAHGGEGVFQSGAILQFVAGLKTATDAVQQFAIKISSTAMGKPEALAATTPGALLPGQPVILGGMNPPMAPSMASLMASMPSSVMQQEVAGGPLTPGTNLPDLPSPINLKNRGLALASAAGGPSEAPIEGADETSKMFQQINKSGDVFAKKLGDFATKLSGAAEGVMGFVQSMTKSKSGGEGALSGAMSGLKMGSAAGPYGMAAGAIIGGVMGGIFGAKEKQLQEDIHKIQDQMQSIVDSMNEGAITLSQAIADMRKERQAAIAMLAQDPKASKGGGKGGKKGFGPSQGQAIINQIDAQIGQLVNEQKQLLDQLNQQVAILSSPVPFQQYVQSLDTIITKYQQFSSAAAGNAQEVANAQTYLNESLQAYVTTLSQQLNQAQQQAIQDSLTLLSLEYQRQQIINQEAQQEYDILTQGVLTRQRTTAMTKGQEIGQLRYQRDMQLQQIDEQIALQQYKVQTEQKIFDLATTRIGLETQLLSLQQGQTDYQNEQTAALLQVVQQLQTAMSNGTLQSSISALSAGGASPTSTGLLTTLMGSLGLGGYVPSSVMTGVGGATNYLAQIPQPYQSITNFVNNLDPNFLMNLWSVMQTPAGSSQRSSVVSEASQFADDANTSGYDMGAFVSWIKSGPPISASVATITNAPVATGAQPLPTGTTFAQPTTPGYSPSSIPSAPVNTGTPYQAVSGSMDVLTTNTNTAAQAMQNLTTVMQSAVTAYNQTKVAAGGTITNPILASLQSNMTPTTSGGGGGIAGLQVYSPGMSDPFYIYNQNKDLQYEELSKMPSFRSGTSYVPKTGPAFLHEGESVLPKPITALLNAMSTFTLPAKRSNADPRMSSIAEMMMPSTSTSSSDLAIHSKMLDIANKKATVEMSVISARSSLLDSEMAHLSALNDILDKISSMGSSLGPAGSLESQFQQVYQTRGRYGSATFRGTVL